MKTRIFSIVLVLVMVFAVVSCGKDAAGADITGKYTVKAAAAEGVYLDPAAIGAEYVIEIKADGKGTMSMEGETVELEWALNGTEISLTVEGETQTATITDGVIFMNMEGAEMWFVKDGASLPKDVAEKMETALDLSGIMGE